MVDIAAVGKSDFIVGFQLAGIRKTVDVTENALEKINELRQNKAVGLVVIDQAVLDALDEDDRIDIEDSVSPVFIPVSTKLEQGSLKRLIKKSIGVDLLD